MFHIVYNAKRTPTKKKRRACTLLQHYGSYLILFWSLAYCVRVAHQNSSLFVVVVIVVVVVVPSVPLLLLLLSAKCRYYRDEIGIVAYHLSNTTLRSYTYTQNYQLEYWTRLILFLVFMYCLNTNWQTINYMKCFSNK